MRRFFHKFSSNGERGSGETNDLKERSNHVDISEKETILEGLPARPRQSNGGDKVRNLAARFESLSTGNDSRQKKVDVLPLPLRKSSLAPKSLSASSDKDCEGPPDNASSKEQNSAAGVQQDPPTSLSIQESNLRQQNDEQIRSATWAEQSSESVDHHLEDDPIQSSECTSEEKLASVSSAMNSESSLHQAHQTSNKTVLFAPSPEKPTRPTSPRLGNRLHNQEARQSPVSSSIIAHFARPTVASSARVKIVSKHHSADMAMVSTRSTLSPVESGSTESGQRNRPSSSLSNNAASIRRSISASGPGRPQLTSSSKCAIDTASPIMTRAMSSNASLRPSQDKGPLSSRNRSTKISDRCTSPQSILSTSSHFNGSLLPHTLDSRRSSWAGHTDSAGSSTIFNWSSTGAKSIGGPSWSEMTQEELVNNLGSRERTRQEVLWEIVASEERYVSELQRTMELYLDPLLHPVRFENLFDNMKSPVKSPLTSTRDLSMQQLGSNSRARYVDSDSNAATARNRLKEEESVNQTPMKKTFDYSVTSGSPAVTPKSSNRTGNDPRNDLRRWSNGKLVYIKDTLRNSQGLNGDISMGIPLSSSLRITLEAISSGLLEAHLLLSEALKHRYEEQWPLVRSLADVFSKHDQIWQHYTDYVIHLERALDTLDEATLMEKAMRGKRFKRGKLPSSVALGRAIATLESAAMEQGECSLSIFLAMPFQRLLKYPLLFQNLLYHTDASTYEFESTVKMVVNIEKIVRSIEDEKTDKEERDKVIDALARIDGIKDKSLLRPKKDRILMEERALYDGNPRRANSDTKEQQDISTSNRELPLSFDSHQSNALASLPLSSRAALKDKRSYRRLSDFLSIDDRQKSTKAPNLGSKKDLWIIRFSDVEIKCQRVGVTALPMVSSVISQTTRATTVDKGDQVREDDEVEAFTDMTEEESRIKDDFKRSKESKERMSALRNTTLRSKTRNLYKFISVISWKQIEKRESKDLSQLFGLTIPQEIDEEDGEDEDDRSSRTSLETDIGVLDSERYIRQSKLSFSYWGQDRVEPQIPKGVTTSRGQSQHTRSAILDHHYDEKESAKMKRHSYTPTNIDGEDAALMSSKSMVTNSRMVMTNSHTESKINKFGNRLRATGGDVNDHANRSRGILSRMKAEEPVTSDCEQVIVTQEQERGIPLMQTFSESQIRKESIRGNCSLRQSLSRDQSIDSTLKLMGNFINDGEEQRLWR